MPYFKGSFFSYLWQLAPSLLHQFNNHVGPLIWSSHLASIAPSVSLCSLSYLQGKGGRSSLLSPWAWRDLVSFVVSQSNQQGVP